MYILLLDCFKRTFSPKKTLNKLSLRIPYETKILTHISTCTCVDFTDHFLLMLDQSNIYFNSTMYTCTRMKEMCTHVNIYMHTLKFYYYY